VACDSVGRVPNVVSFHLIKSGQATRIKLTEDEAFGNSVNAAKSQPLRQLLQFFAHQPLVPRGNHREPITPYDPVGGSLVEQAALIARVQNNLGVVARAGEFQRLRLHRGEHVKVHEAVIQRGYQGIGHRMDQRREMALVPGGVDDYEVVAFGHVLDRFNQLVIDQRLFLGGA